MSCAAVDGMLSTPIEVDEKQSRFRQGFPSEVAGRWILGVNGFYHV